MCASEGKNYRTLYTYIVNGIRGTLDEDPRDRMTFTANTTAMYHSCFKYIEQMNLIVISTGDIKRGVYLDIFLR